MYRLRVSPVSPVNIGWHAVLAHISLDGSYLFKTISQEQASTSWSNADECRLTMLVRDLIALASKQRAYATSLVVFVHERAFPI